MHAFIKRHERVCNIFEKATEPFYIDTNEPGWHKKVSQNSQERYKIRIRQKDVVKVFVPSVQVIIVDDKEQYVVILTDVTELESEKEKLRVLAMSDPLTGASNRLQFNTMIDKFIEVSRRYDAPLSIIMFDVDHFKQINDNYSHQVGDDVLKRLVTIISEDVRKADLFVRWGGEEFLIVLSNTSIENAATAAEKFRKTVNDESFAEIDAITCSFGVSQMHPEDNISDFIARVDEALYQAKKAGRNCVKSID
jgi:diguanylate cyclase (GGDEF)-like protein